MSSALMTIENSSQTLEFSLSSHALPVPWRNPYEVSPSDLTAQIKTLELACKENPKSPDLHTCLGMAYAMNYQVYESMRALESARALDKRHFYAQFKYAELLYRLRALPRAEQETVSAISLATNMAELSAVRRQLAHIRQLIREGTQKPEWTKSLKTPALVLVGLFVVLSWATVMLR
jgi:hypothetical protein